jgi:acyl-CoA dehydrogenase
MSELEAFRTEIRAWIEANCPPEMKTPIKSDDDTCWGGRNFVFQSEAQKQWMERCAAAGADCARLAKGLWRRRPVAC